MLELYMLRKLILFREISFKNGHASSASVTDVVVVCYSRCLLLLRIESRVELPCFSRLMNQSIDQSMA